MFANMDSLPDRIQRKRKFAGVGCIFQFISAIAGIFVYLFLRRVPMVLIINLFTACLSIVGYVGANHMHRTQISIHGFTTVVLLGGFFIYQIIELLFLTNSASDKILLLLISIPYLVDFIAGCLSLNLYFEILEPPTISEVPEEYQIPLIENANNLCKICYDRPCTMVVYPCGHKCLCAPCSRNLIKSLSKCPFCRGVIRDMILVYE
ncbi:unnamed protein product [Blepharisma stoltei]|uniref:RING-type domain-containing protein n=1 Tax=Blepharisma stoltei TaxID=1481888 RepID=A0AAU9JIQ4_9CILI|nr:unnamed protein product [Blepharisma stoltei]